MKTRPVQPVDERGELRRRQTHHAVADRRPAKRVLLKPLPVEHEPRPVPGQNLQPVRTLRAEDDDHAREGIALKLLARESGEAVGAASEVHRLRRDQNPRARRNRDHVAALTARSTAVSVAASTPGATRTVAAPITISMTEAPPPSVAATGASRLGRASSTTTGTKAVPSAAASSFAARLASPAVAPRAASQRAAAASARGAARQPTPCPRCRRSRRGSPPFAQGSTSGVDPSR